MNRLSLLLVRGVLAGGLAAGPMANAAERFDDIFVAPQVPHSAETFHGYQELRVLLENHSARDSHVVTLILPDRAYRLGNSIDRLSRTVTIGPGARAMIPLWLPPLPLGGNDEVRVIVDGDRVGTVRFSGSSGHLSRSGRHYRDPQTPGVLLVSRNLNYDDANRAFQGENAAFSAGMAVGASDVSFGRHVSMPTAWSPDFSHSGPHWIELEYDPPIIANRIEIYHSVSPPNGEIVLTGVSGTNLHRLSISGSGGSSGLTDVTFAATPEPVKKVRLEFSSGRGTSLGIDAVKLLGPADSGWATQATASSEYTGGGSAGFSGQAGTRVVRSELPMSEMSEYWLSYTPFDGIALGGAELTSVPPAVAAALWHYVECGGNLILLGGGEVPAPWNAHGQDLPQGGRRFNVGFGNCFVLEQPNPSALGRAGVRPVMNALSESSRYWQSLPVESAANSVFPILENLKVPIRGTVFIMLAFVLLIGPTNVIVLSRLRRRTWLLWTIPAISLATCLIVFGYSFLREGITPDVRTEGITLLDQVNRRATSIGMTAFYCPLTPSQGLTFNVDTEATPLVDTWDRDGGSRREVDWTRAQHFQRGWVTARVPAHFLLRKSEVRRERIELETADGTLRVLNGLGAPIRTLWLADASGKVYQASQIGAGQKAELQPMADAPDLTQKLGPHGLFKRFESSPSDLDLTNTAVSFLMPGSYIADLEQNPFLENGLGAKAASARNRERSVVYGILEPAPQP